jgi:hypothetical protein
MNNVRGKLRPLRDSRKQPNKTELSNTRFKDLIDVNRNARFEDKINM